MWYYIKIGSLIFSSKDYLIMKQLIEETNNNYIIQKTTKDLSKYEVDEQYFY